MMQFLPRGLQVFCKNRIKRLVVGTGDWQIYITNVDSYVLAVKPSLYYKWVSSCFLPQDIFVNDIDPQYWIFQSKKNYIISSVEFGPYPQNSNQVEGFSFAFKKALDLFENRDISDAVYIEEYSIILPVTDKLPTEDKGVIYGRWLTGGIKISINSFDRVSKIMTWIPQEILIEAATNAGFDMSFYDQSNITTIIKLNEKLQPKVEYEDNRKHIIESKTKTHFTLTGRFELENFFNDNIIDIVLNQEKYQRMGISFPGATVLYGPPGCGKTYAVEKLIEFLGWQRFDIDSTTIASSYIHDTSKKISEVFQSAIDASPSVLVIDEMEAFLSIRESKGTNGSLHVEEVAEFLRQIPKAISNKVLVFAMTNMIDLVDPAVLRKGRFDHIIEVGMASEEEIVALLNDSLKEIPISKDIDIISIARALSGRPLSDVTFVIRESGRVAIKRELNYISNDCFNDAIALLPKNLEKPRIGFLN